MVNIYLAAPSLGKLHTLATSGSVNNCYLSDFFTLLMRAVTLSHFHEDGNPPLSRDKFMIYRKEGARIPAESLSRRAPMLPKPYSKGQALARKLKSPCILLRIEIQF